MNTNALEQGRCLSDHERSAAQTESVTTFTSKKDIIDSIQIRDQAEFLKNDADPPGDCIAIARKPALLSCQKHHALILALDTTDNLDDCRFPGTILTQQGVDLSTHQSRETPLSAFTPGKLLVMPCSFRSGGAKGESVSVMMPRCLFMMLGLMKSYQLKLCAPLASTSCTSTGTVAGGTAPQYFARAMARARRTC